MIFIYPLLVKAQLHADTIIKNIKYQDSSWFFKDNKINNHIEGKKNGLWINYIILNGIYMAYMESGPNSDTSYSEVDDNIIFTSKIKKGKYILKYKNREFSKDELFMKYNIDDY